MRNAMIAGLLAAVCTVALLGWGIYWRGRALTCEASTTTLQKQVREHAARARIAKEESKATTKAANGLRAKADAVLQQPQAVPGDECASAAAVIREYERGRK